VSGVTAPRVTPVMFSLARASPILSPMNNRSPLGHQWWALGLAFPACLVLVEPLQRHASTVELTLSAAGVAAFIVLYISALLAWKRGDSGIAQTAGIAVIGALFAPFNSTAWIFFLFAAGFSPWVAAGDLAKIALMAVALFLLAGIETVLLHLPWIFVASVVVYSLPTLMIAALTLRRAIAVRELAATSERERIARDMHDVLGHTLSVIILKSDLASRLAHKSPDRAVAELAEVDHIARDTLEQVRQTLRGYRAQSLEHEFELAKTTLTIAGLRVTTDFQRPRALGVPQENILCLALREGVTNIVRHARAGSCRLAVSERSGICQLEIEDDGQRAAQGAAQGQGLLGMRERVEESGGTVTQRVDQGTKLTISIPLNGNAKVMA
jgi:two-component system sensor histidine kinase DesK